MSNKNRRLVRVSDGQSPDKIGELITGVAQYLNLKDGDDRYRKVMSPIIEEFYDNSVFCSYIKECGSETITANERKDRVSVYDEELNCYESYDEEDLQNKIQGLTEALRFIQANK